MNKSKHPKQHPEDCLICGIQATEYNETVDEMLCATCDRDVLKFIREIKKNESEEIPATSLPEFIVDDILEAYDLYL